jgi:[ribosomal protein S5]-alanine N-acetyltransferase
MPSPLLRLETPRLELIAATVEMLIADLAGREQLAAALKVDVPDAWPPMNWEREPIEFLVDWMRRRSDAHGWFAWYCISRRTDFQSVHLPSSAGPQVENLSSTRLTENLPCNTLIGGIGFLGPPNAAGETIVGYSLLPNYHRQGYCPEALSALIDWAFSHGESKTLVVRTIANHRPSIRVAEKLGFEFAGPGPEPNTVEYVLCHNDWKVRQAEAPAEPRETA